ncbi:MAG: hypothetical protein ACAI25_00520 [Planctomycetota bacterium]
MKASKFVYSLALLVALSGVAKAQDGKLQPTEGGNAPAMVGGDNPGAPAPAQDPVAPPPNTPQAPATADTPTVEGQPKDPGGWKQSTPAPAQAGVPEADPLAKPAEVDPAAAEAEKKKNDKIIEKNYDTAIKIYEGVLKNEGESMENLDHRIGTNEKLIAKYKKALAEANEVKRREQVNLFNRTFYLKQQRDKGAIPEDTFDKLMKTEEKKYNEKTSQARSDIDFYTKEIADAEKRMNDLKTERRISVTSIKATQAANGKKAKPPVKASQKIVNSLKDRLQRLSEFEPKHTMDNAPLCEPCVQTSPGAPAPAPAEAAPAPDK